MKEKEEGETTGAVEEEVPKPEGGCVGAAMALPKPGVDDDDGAAVEPNPPPAAAKLKVLAWAGAADPKPRDTV